MQNPRGRIAFMVLAATFAASAVAAQTTLPGDPGSAKRMQAMRTTMSITIDGRLDEAAWAEAVPATDFVQREPKPGLPASLRTEARVLFDRDAVYIGMRMYDAQPDSIHARLVRRDRTGGGSDWAHVWIDSYYDRRTAFHFGTTPRGSRVDMLHSDDTRADTNWDAVWDVATSIDAEGWTAEFRIPLSQLRFSSNSSGEWGIQFAREIARRSELSYWAEWAPDAAGRVSLFGTLEGLTDLAAPRRIEVSPYTVTRLAREPGADRNPFFSRNDFSAAAGADLKFGVTSDLTLTATLNPDFGQVEADPSVVNLTSFETFFPEKRPFFTEGSDIFSFGMAPEGTAFYSRRIGRAPQRGAPTPAGGYDDTPESARILAAAKLSGKTKGGWSIGVLNALTREANASIADSLGVLQPEEPVEPFTSYTVARVVRDFRRGQSGIGLITTATNRRLDDERLQFLRENAYTAGGNAWHRFGGGRYRAGGWLLGTHVNGSRAALLATQRNSVHRMQRPDADHLSVDSSATSLDGWAAEAGVSRAGGGKWRWNVGTGARSPGVDVNDIGFLSFTDIWYLAAGLNYNQFQPGRHVRNWSVSFDNVHAFTFGNEPILRERNLNANAQLHNLYGVEIGAGHTAAAPWPWELRGGPALRLPARMRGYVRGYTDGRRARFYELGINGEYAPETNMRTLGISPGITLRPSASAVVVLTAAAGWNRNPTQYIRTSTALGTSHYILGHLEQRTLSLTGRVSYLFAPDLSFDFYAQPFLSAGQYSQFKRVIDPRAHEYENRLATYAERQVRYDAARNRYNIDADDNGTVDFGFGNPDFSVRELNTNAVLRWEYRPGSALFVVWSHARDDDLLQPGLQLRRDVDRLVGAPARHVFMVKLSYWASR